MKIGNIKFIKEIRYTFASISKRGNYKLLIKKPPPDYNPIVEKTFQKKYLDNVNYLENLENIMKNIQNKEENPSNCFSDLNLNNILQDFSKEEDKVEFTPKKEKEKKSFASMSECFEYLEKNQQNFCNEAMKYAKVLFYTVMNIDANAISEFLKNENNLIILKNLYAELEKETNENGFMPIIKDSKKELKKIFEINELTPLFSLILDKFFSKYLLSIDLKKFFEILKSFEGFLYYSLSKNEFRQKIQENLKIFFKQLMKNLDKFTFKEKINISFFMQGIKFYEANFLDYMSIYCDLNFDNIEIPDILLILSLNMNFQRTFPFELLYKTKKRILKTPLEKLPPKILLRILRVYSKKKLFFMENFFEIIFNEIISERVFNNFVDTDYASILYYYSSSFYRDENLFQKILLKIEKEFKAEDAISFRNILISLAQLNYINNDFFMKLKENKNVLQTIEKLKNEDISNDQKKYFNLLIKRFEESKDEKINLDSQQANSEVQKDNKE